MEFRDLDEPITQGCPQRLKLRHWDGVTMSSTSWVRPPVGFFVKSIHWKDLKRLDEKSESESGESAHELMNDTISPNEEVSLSG